MGYRVSGEDDERLTRPGSYWLIVESVCQLNMENVLRFTHNTRLHDVNLCICVRVNNR